MHVVTEIGRTAGGGETAWCRSLVLSSAGGLTDEGCERCYLRHWWGLACVRGRSQKAARVMVSVFFDCKVYGVCNGGSRPHTLYLIVISLSESYHGHMDFNGNYLDKKCSPFSFQLDWTANISEGPSLDKYREHCWPCHWCGF